MYYLGLGIIALLCICLGTFFFVPRFTLLFLLGIRSSIGVFRNIAVSIVGLPVNVLGIYSLFVLFLAAVQGVTKRLSITNAPLLLYLCFSLWGFTTCLYAPDKIQAVTHAFKIVAPVSMLFLLINLQAANQTPKQIIEVVVYSSIIPISYGFIQAILGIGNLRSGILRINSTFILPNPFGFYLCLICLSSIALYYLSHSKKEKILAALFFTAATTSLFLTGTRTSFIAFALSAISYLIIEKKIKYLFISAWLIVLVMAIKPDIRNRIAEPVQKIGHVVTSGSLVKELHKNKEIWEMDTLEWRMRYWVEVTNEYLKRPFLGYGIGNTQTAMKKSKRGKLEPHNDYLRLLMETGLIGFLLYMSFVLCMLLHFIKSFFRSSNDTNKMYYGLCISCILCLCIIMVGDNIIYANTFLWYFFSIMAVGYIIRSRELALATKNVKHFDI